MEGHSSETLLIVLSITQVNRLISLLPFLITSPLSCLRGQPVKPVRLVLDLNVRVFVLDVDTKEAVEYFLELAELWAVFWVLTPAVKHLVVAV